MPGRFVLDVRGMRRPLEAAAGDAGDLRRGPVHGGRDPGVPGDGALWRRRAPVGRGGRAAWGGPQAQRRPRVRHSVRRPGGQAALPGDLRVRGGHAVPCEGCAPDRVHARGLRGMRVLGHLAHRARDSPVRGHALRQGGRTEGRRDPGRGPDRRLHRAQDRGQGPDRHQAGVRRDPDGGHKLHRVPADGHRPAGYVPAPGAQGGPGHCDILAVPRRRHQGYNLRDGQGGVRRRHSRCQDTDIAGRRHKGPLPDRRGRIRRLEDGGDGVMLTRPCREGMDAPVAPGGDVREDCLP